jgi:lipoyl(octanoyl) transferase
MTSLQVKQLGMRDYAEVWQLMQEYTDSRTEDTPDQLWCLEHPPVFTQGQAGKEEHLLAPGDIPVIKVDRGGQVTYHGPGQLVLYTLIDIRRLKLSVRDLVTAIEDAVIEILAASGIKAHSDRDAPGVYTESGEKICSVGLRIRRGRSFHGLALNVMPDLSPFERINPCGYPGLRVTSMANLGVTTDVTEVSKHLVNALTGRLGYNSAVWLD